MKKVLVLSLLGLVVVGVLTWSAGYLSTGTIVITTGRQDSTISLRGANQGNSFNKIGLGSLSATVSHGLYTATVKNGSQVVMQSINFNKGHRTLRYSIALSGLLQVEPVAYQNARSLAASNTELVYLGAGDENLHKIDNQNSVTTSNSSRRFKTVKWASTAFGVGQDNNGRLFIINNASASLLRVPFTYGGEAVNFDVAQNKQIYVSYGAAVYAGDQSGNFKKIYAAMSAGPVLSAGTDRVAIADKTERQSNGVSQPVLAIVSNAGKVTNSKGEGEIRSLVLSPNGRYLVSANESSAGVYNASLQKIATVPADSSVSYVAWLDDTRFVYASGGGLWLYDLSAQKTELLANVPFLDGSITGLYVSGDGSYVYLTAGSNNGYAVFRVGLRGQQVPDYIAKLQDILPLTLNDCSVSVVNFTQPAAILVQSFPSGNLSPQAYLQEAQSGLTRSGFDVSKFQFKFVPGS